MQLTIETTTLICKICFGISLCALAWAFIEHRKEMNKRNDLLRKVMEANERLRAHLKFLK